LELGAERSVRLGWTQLQIAGNSFHEVDLLCRLYATGRIKLRLYDAIYGPSADVQRLLAEGPSINRCGDRLTVRGIKLYIDGALGSRGAALLAPYSDAPDTRGLTVNSEATLLPILTQALRLGPERLKGAYAWRSLLATGAVVVAGSDAPVEKGDPLIEFYAAVARRSVDGYADENWHLEQRVSRTRALKMLSSGPAYAAFQE